MQKTKSILILYSILFPVFAIGQISHIRIINDTSSNIYIHIGGYAPSQKLKAGRWTTLRYPLHAIPPNSKTPLATSILVASAGGRWHTTPNGFTYLKKPHLCVTLDLTAHKIRNLKGTYQWTISTQKKIEPGCKITGFKQLWWQPKQP